MPVSTTGYLGSLTVHGHLAPRCICHLIRASGCPQSDSGGTLGTALSAQLGTRHSCVNSVKVSNLYEGVGLNSRNYTYLYCFLSPSLSLSLSLSLLLSLSTCQQSTGFIFPASRELAVPVAEPPSPQGAPSPTSPPRQSPHTSL